MHYKKATQFASVTIPGFGVVQGDTILTGSQYEKFVGLGLLEPCSAPKAPSTKAATPPAPTPADASGTAEEPNTDGPDTKPTAKKTPAKKP
jgi:hypothetical protein